MAGQREPHVTTRLRTMCDMVRLDVLRSLIRADLSWPDQVSVLTVLIDELTVMRDRRSQFAVQHTDVSYAEMGRRLGVSSSYAARMLREFREDPDAA